MLLESDEFAHQHLRRRRELETGEHFGDLVDITDEDCRRARVALVAAQVFADHLRAKAGRIIDVACYIVGGGIDKGDLAVATACYNAALVGMVVGFGEEVFGYEACELDDQIACLRTIVAALWAQNGRMSLEQVFESTPMLRPASA